MMKIEDFISVLGADFFTGVPDSLLRPFCDYVYTKYGLDSKHHVVAANEGNAAALAAGYHLATGKIPVVYLQNSGEGNIINPLASLLSKDVYGIPVIFVIGWRGEPGVHDEPQHVHQGKVTLSLLETMSVPYIVIDSDKTSEELRKEMQNFRSVLTEGGQLALVVRKEALENSQKVKYKNDNLLTREKIIRQLLKYTGEDKIVSTTGKASRELFELREERGEGHERDFLTVGSMGHSSSIALGFALHNSNKKIWGIDGDGAVLMHMGAIAVIGNVHPQNFVHVVINNAAHESVGGMPTVAGNIDFPKIAKACGYDDAFSVKTEQELDAALNKIIKQKGLLFLEVKSAIGARKDLGRPTTTPQENKVSFMQK